MSESTRSATEAFDALREEVGKLRNGMELIYRQGQEISSASKPKDYDPTLGAMLKRLGQIEDNVLHLKFEVVELPGERFLPHELVAITKQAKDAALELREATGHAIRQKAMRWWLAGTAAFGVALGIALCICTATVFPKAAGAWAAGAIVGGDPWDAGQTLMRQADPTSYDRMVRLYQACPQDVSVNICRDAMMLKTATPAVQ